MIPSKDSKKNPDVAMYRYSVITNHGKKRFLDNSDEFEMEMSHGIRDELDPFSPFSKPKTRIHQSIKQNNPKTPNSQKPVNIQKPKISKESNRYPNPADFNQGFPVWQDKGKQQDFLSQGHTFIEKKKKGIRPNRVPGFPSPTNFENSNDNFSGFDDFPEFPSFSTNKNNKRFPPSSVSPPPSRIAEYERGDIKSTYNPFREQTRIENKRKKTTPQYPPAIELIKSIELTGENFSGENTSPEFDFPQKPFRKQEKPQSNFYLNHPNPPKQYKKPHKQQDNPDVKFQFSFPQRLANKPQKQQQNSPSIDFSYDFPHQKHFKKQHKQQQSVTADYSYDYDSQQNTDMENEQGVQSAVSNSGSDWIPINAPEGALPARSYDIPAPDLSRGSYEEREPYEREWPGELQKDDEDNFRFASSETVYGVQKGGHSANEEVVSATFRVKQ